MSVCLCNHHKDCHRGSVDMWGHQQFEEWCLSVYVVITKTVTGVTCGHQQLEEWCLSVYVVITKTVTWVLWTCGDINSFEEWCLSVYVVITKTVTGVP